LPNSLKTFRNAFIERNRKPPASLTTAPGQLRPKIRLFWQKSSLSQLFSSPALRLLTLMCVPGDNQRQKDAHRDGKQFIVCADEKLTAFLELEVVIRVGSNELAKLANFSVSWIRSQPREHAPCRLLLFVVQTGSLRINQSEERKGRVIALSLSVFSCAVESEKGRMHRA